MWIGPLNRLQAAILAGLILSAPAGGTEAAVADSLVLAAADTARPRGERIALLRRALKAAPDHAGALHALGLLYMAQNTISGRARARSRFERLIRLAPENVAYHMSYATLLRKQGFAYNAMRHFKKVLEMHPGHAEAACEVGEYMLQDMFKYIDSPRFDGRGSMRSFGEESAGEAEFYFRYALEGDPGCRRAYYRLGFLSLERGRPEELVRLSRRLLARFPNDRDGWLFLGLGHQATGDFEAADRAYGRALALMGGERWVMEHPELMEMIASPDERPALSFAAGMGGAPSVPGPLLDRFWLRRDPLFLTPYNERRMAHYGRVAYANLRFSRPDEGVAGWETDMGRVLIRFGRYLARERRIEPYRETWFYEDFQVSFYSFDSVHWWVDLLVDDTWITGGYGRGDLFSPRFRRRERFVDPYVRQKYRLACQVAAFKAPGDSLRVELAWALPKERLDYLALYGACHTDLDAGVFLFDTADAPVVQRVERRALFREAWTDTLKSRFLLDRASFTVAAGTYRLALEARDREKGTIGTFGDTLALAPFGEVNLGMSSIVLASRMSEGMEGQVEVLPNPLRTYGRGELLHLYFEVYNLAQDAFGGTRYRVEYRIGAPKARRLPVKLDREALARLGLDGEGWTISVTSEYRGDRPDEPLRLEIDLSELAPGLQLLTLKVTDEVAGLSTGREALFRIVE